MRGRVDEPWVGIYLSELLLMDCNWLAGLVEDEEPCAGGSLIDTADENFV